MIDYHLETGEQVCGFYRRHWAQLLGPIGITLVMLLPPAILLLLPGVAGFTVSRELGASLWLFGGLYLGFVASYFMMEWTLWYLDTWILTDQRLVDIQVTSPFRRRIAELPLDQVQDVTASQSGFLPSILDFGDVRVQSAAKESFFFLRAISQPHALQRRILTLSSAVRNPHPEPPRQGEA